MEKTNELIAEFMGVDHVDIDTWLETNSNLKYHTSWDWLQPVIQKVIPLTDSLDNKYYDSIVDALITNDIEQCYNTVVGFIKEYNQND